MGKSKFTREVKKKPHSPPSCCRLCGESHYMGLEHICVLAKTDRSITRFGLQFWNGSRHGPFHSDLGWVQAERELMEHGQGSVKQIYAMLNKAKEKDMLA